VGHPLEVLGVRDGAGVHAVAVAGAPRLDLLDVGVDLLLLGREVVDDDARVARLVVDLGPRGRERGDLRDLGEVGALVAQLVGAGVERLQVEELDLGGGVGFQRSLLCIRGGRSTGRWAAC
jgi:hypothetical protein